MSDKSDQKKILRIGLIQDGKIVEEKLIRSRSDVRVGQEFERNDLVVPVSDLPDSYPVFEVKGDRYVLNFNDEMSARVSVGGSVQSLQDFKRAGKVQEGKHGYVLPLSPSARGRVQMGEVTLLFQFVEPPPERPQPALPAAMRGGWISGLNTTLLTVVGISALLQGGFVIWVESQDWPQPKNLSKKLDNRFVKVKKEEPDEIKKKPKKKKSEKSKQKKEEKQAAKAEPKKQKKQKKKKEKPSPEEQAKKEAEKQRQMAKEVKNKTIVGELGHVSKDGGSIADALSEGAGKTDMEDAFKGSKGVTSGSGAEKSGLETSGSSDAEGSGKAAGIGDLKKSAGAKKAQKGQETGEKKEQQVQAEVDLEGPSQQAGTGTLNQSSVSSKIKMYASAIQKCYERQLKKDSSLSGKVVVSFTIGTAGSVTNASPSTDSVGSGVGNCVAQTIKRIKFPKPKGGKVMVNKTFVFQAGN